MISTAEAHAPTVKSFRDPAGTLLRQADGRILRSVGPAFVADFEAFLATRAARDAVGSGRLVGSARLPAPECRELALENVFEHERIPFASYPYEWPAEMLHAAGALTLDLAIAALEDGFGIKDATPYNV